jgi:xanthine dehydrogenase accessory factor
VSTLRDTAAGWLADGEPAVLVEVTEALGSAPREAGTRMLVSAVRCAGTVGGGHLELKAIERARRMLAGESVAPSAHYPLGPALGQCCGGAVTLAFTPLDAKVLGAWPKTAPRFHLQLYGAGHVGRAIVQALAPLNVVVDWIDQRGDFTFFGLIGSKTKRNRFVHRFEQRGIPAEAIARMTCPIGVPGIEGKEPEVIAAAVVAQLLQVSSRRHAAVATPFVREPQIP